MEEKIFFSAGETVKVKQNIDGPLMVVKMVNKANVRGEADKPMLIGVTCFWFTKNNEYQSQMFSTKDLQKASK
jgi:uncharacterized protein YodC (DUF2158 family)